MALIVAESDILVKAGLPETAVRKMGLIPIKTLVEGLSYIEQEHGDISPATLMPQRHIFRLILHLRQASQNGRLQKMPQSNNTNSSGFQQHQDFS